MHPASVGMSSTIKTLCVFQTLAFWVSLIKKALLDKLKCFFLSNSLLKFFFFTQKLKRANCNGLNNFL